MPEKLFRIGIVAPACRFDELMAQRVKEIAAQCYPNGVELVIHPQCYLSAGHFAGDDAARVAAFVEVANDPGIDAVWFARGGYGAIRIIATVLPRLNAAARRKAYLGYSDIGSLLAALYAQGFENVAHGPMPSDLARQGGDEAVRRALAFLVERKASAIEPTVASAEKCAAFNITILSHLIGTPYLPDLSDHVLMLEEVSEHMYRIDRALAQITFCPAIRKVSGIRLGRCSQIPANDPDFAQSEVEVIEHWCKVSGIRYLGRADIGHDAQNKIVPFGATRIA